MTTRAFEIQAINDNELERVLGGTDILEQWKNGEGPLHNYYPHLGGGFLTYQELVGNN